MTSAEISHHLWGTWPSVRLATSEVEFEVVSELGARVVSLRDRRRDREWLLQGAPPDEPTQMAWAEEGAVFGGAESFGWDECLPTTSVCADPLAPGGPALRDHGDQWGRGAYLAIDQAGAAVEHTWSVPRWAYRLHRRLSFADERTLLAEYLLISLADGPLPIHWAQHPVLRLEPGSRVDLPGVERISRSWQAGIDLPATSTWPRTTTSDGRKLDLDQVRSGEGWAAVLYAKAHHGARAVTPDGACLELDWDRSFAPWLRVWLSCGGWPPGGPPAEQVALEACTAPFDHLQDALVAGMEKVLGPNAELRWWTRLRIS